MATRRTAPSSLLATALVLSCASQRTPPPPTPQRTPVVASSVDAEAWRRTVPAPGRPRAVPYPAADVETLSNGIRVHAVRRPGEILTVSVVSRLGAAAKTGGRGIAALTVRMMTEGTHSHPGLALSAAVEDLGGELDQDAGRDHVRLALTGLASDRVALMRLLSEISQEATFDPSILERVRAEWIDDLVAARQAPATLSALAGFRGIWGPTYGAPVAGTPEEVSGIRREDLLAFHREAFRASNLAICIVGNISTGEAVDLAEASFGNPPTGVRVRRTSSAAPGSNHPDAGTLRPGIYVVDRPGSVQTAIFAGHAFPRRDAEGHEARQILNNALGGLFTSRLNTNLRERNAYTYGARSIALATRDRGLFAVMTSVRTDATASSLTEILGELRDVRGPRPLALEELDRGRTDLVQQVGSHLEGLAAVREDAETLFVDGLPRDYFATYGARLDVIDPEAIRRAANLLAPEKLVVVLVGDVGQMGDLAALGRPVDEAPESLTK